MVGPFPTEYTDEELNAWLNTLDIYTSIGIIEKLFKDYRDHSLSIIHEHMENNPR